MVEKIWMRMGDQGDYEEFGSPYDAGDHIGLFFSEDSKMPTISRYGEYGVEIEPRFPGPYNYVSLFWGDADAQPTQSLTAEERSQFKAGLAAGAGIQVKTKPVKRKPKRKTEVRGGGAGLLRMR